MKIDALVVIFAIYEVDFRRRVYKSGVGFEFIEKISILKIDALVVIFGIYGVCGVAVWCCAVPNMPRYAALRSQVFPK